MTEHANHLILWWTLTGAVRANAQLDTAQEQTFWLSGWTSKFDRPSGRFAIADRLLAGLNTVLSIEKLIAPSLVL